MTANHSALRSRLSGADQRQVREGLREVPQRLAAGPGLLGVQPEMIGVAEHPLEDQPRVVQARRVACPARVSASTSQNVQMLKVPSLPCRPSGARLGVVAVDQAVRDQAALARAAA